MKYSAVAVSLLFSSTAMACAPLLGLTYCFDNLSPSDQDLARLEFKSRITVIGGDSQLLSSQNGDAPKADNYMYTCSIGGKPKLAEPCPKADSRCEPRRFRSDTCIAIRQ